MSRPSSRRPVAVVMTATIAPPGNAPALARRDPAVRLRDYLDALSFYLALPTEVVDRVILIENSGSDLGPLQDLAGAGNHGKRVEVTGVAANDHPPEFGKGYGEFKLLDMGLGASKLLCPEDKIWKVTGRLKVANLARLVETAPSAYDVYCDLRNLPLVGRRLGGNQWMELRVFSCSVAAYDRWFRAKYEHLKVVRSRPPVGPEHVLYEWMRERMAEGGQIVPRFRIQPVFCGRGGHMDVDYQGARYKAKEILRASMRRLVPWIWL